MTSWIALPQQPQAPSPVPVWDRCDKELALSREAGAPTLSVWMAFPAEVSEELGTEWAWGRWWLASPELVAQERATGSKTTLPGKAESPLPWQQLGASLSVWLTAAAPDWLRRPAPPLLRRSLTLSSSCILPEADGKGGAWLGVLGLCAACTLPRMGGSPLQGISPTPLARVAPSIQEQAAGKTKPDSRSSQVPGSAQPPLCLPP